MRTPAPIHAAVGQCYALDVDPRERRAEHRRQTWQGGVVKSFDDAEKMDLEFWLSQTPEGRLRALTDLVYEMMGSDSDGAPPRLQRAVGGVRPLKG
jgi:hypothetical protein